MVLTVNPKTLCLWLYLNSTFFTYPDCGYFSFSPSFFLTSTSQRLILPLGWVRVGWVNRRGLSPLQVISLRYNSSFPGSNRSSTDPSTPFGLQWSSPLAVDWRETRRLVVQERTLVRVVVWRYRCSRFRVVNMKERKRVEWDNWYWKSVCDQLLSMERDWKI